MDINKAIERFISTRYAKGCTEHTLETYRQELRVMSRYLYGRGLNETTELEPDVLTDFLASYRDRGVSANTLVSVHRRFSTFVKWCGETELSRADIMQRVPRPKAREFIRRVHTDEEVRQLLKTAFDGRLYHPFDGLELGAMLLLLLDTGLRLGELVSLNVSDISGETIRVRGKGEKERLIAVSEPVRQALGDYLKLRHPVFPDQPLWVNRGYGRNHQRRGTRITDRAVYQRLRRLGTAAGISTSPHRWRHTFTVFALRQGASMKALQLFLGHSSIETTDNYLRGFGYQDAAREHKLFSPVAAMMHH